MVILLIFAFISGLLTILAPCIWPLLPIVLSSSATGSHRKPLGITLGVILSFSILTLSVSYLVSIFHFDPNILRVIAAITIAFLGLTLLIPPLLIRYELIITKLSTFIAGEPVAKHHGFFGGFITGLSLGIIWAPCAGPILATIAVLGATQSVDINVILITVAFAVGVGIPLLLFSILGRWLLASNKAVNKYTEHLQKIFGVIMILSALAIYTDYDKVIQAKLLNFFPSYTNLLTSIENNPEVQKQLDILKGSEGNIFKESSGTSDLPKLGKAPEFVGITKWLNSQALTMKELQGKVVLIDFWTYTCINCIRTLPHVVSWHEKYKDKGFTVIGIHTPEFEFEKKTENVQQAIAQYNITYPVPQDNDYATWKAYDNHYWPAKYLVDAQGNVRYIHFGEGNYAETEMAIKTLIEEAGKKADEGLVVADDQTPKSRVTPETYLGSQRMERFASLESITGGIQTFSYQSPVPVHTIAYKGKWDVQKEFAKTVQNSVLEIHFDAKKVFLVVTPGSNNDTAKIYLDNKLVSKEDAGIDVENGIITFKKAQLYNLIDLTTQREHILRIEFLSPNTSVYAFTFG